MYVLQSGVHMLKVKLEKNPGLIKINLHEIKFDPVYLRNNLPQLARLVTLIGELTFVSHVNHKKMYEKLVPLGTRVTFLPKVTFPHIYSA